MPTRKKSKIKSNGRSTRRPWTKADERELKAHSKNKTLLPIAGIDAHPRPSQSRSTIVHTTPR
jgi:hypothetical protein